MTNLFLTALVFGVIIRFYRFLICPERTEKKKKNERRQGGGGGDGEDR